ncbi:XRE family transcriptional regulator [Paraburkholderia gardini]|uniref:XRE family transcriptional regulator n=1 Tax=Paraburkholderia gardini TaxID=2823469 RepID=UPI001E4BA6D3|nr:XRE family transcriptional regulator [Paraburkholderia gardini]
MAISKDIINKDLHEIACFTMIFVMPKTSVAVLQMPPATIAALERLGADLAVARLRRKESLVSWASRLGVSVPTLMRLEAGEPGVGIGIYATALWLIGRDGALAELAAPEKDRGALELDVREAVALGKSRAQASAESRQKRKEKRGG